MKKLFKQKDIALSVITASVALFFIVLTVYGATTIGTNMTTEGYTTSTVGYYTMGLLDVGGSATVRGSATIGGNATITGYATSTVGLYTQGTMHVGGNATTSQIYLPRVKFEQGVVTSTAPADGECFMPHDQLVCYYGSTWNYAW